MASKALAVRRSPSRFRYVGRRAKKRFTLPLAVVAGFVPLGVGVWRRRQSSQDMSDFLVSSMTGYTPSNGQWSFGALKSGLLPVVAGFGVHKVASAIGINRALASAGVPWIRI